MQVKDKDQIQPRGTSGREGNVIRDKAMHTRGFSFIGDIWFLRLGSRYVNVYYSSYILSRKYFILKIKFKYIYVVNIIDHIV